MTKYTYIGVIIILMGCVDSTFLTSEIDPTKWNLVTSKFIKSNCGSLNEVSLPPSRRGFKNNWDIIISKFDMRRKLLSLISKHHETTSELYIWEFYNGDEVDIMFSKNNKDWIEISKANTSKYTITNIDYLAENFECFEKCLIFDKYPIYTKIGILTKITLRKKGELQYNIIGIHLK